MKGYHIWGPFDRKIEDIFRLTMHEVLHQYYCRHTEDLGVPRSGYVMNSNHWSGGRVICDENEGILSDNIKIYDGI